MRATVRNDRTTRVIVLEVSGVTDLDASESWHTKPRMIRPDYITITLVDGEFHEAKAGGPVLKASGEPGLVRATWMCGPTGARYERNTLDQAPEWVQTMAREAPAGVTAWGQPTEVPA